MGRATAQNCFKNTMEPIARIDIDTAGEHPIIIHLRPHHEAYPIARDIQDTYGTPTGIFAEVSRDDYPEVIKVSHDDPAAAFEIMHARNILNQKQLSCCLTALRMAS